MNCLRWLGRCDREFESHFGNGYLVCVCVHLFCVYAVLYLDRGLETGRSLLQGVLTIVYRSKEYMYKRNVYKNKK
jgi:hypothetical protein